MSVALVIVSGTPQVACSTTITSTTSTAVYPNNVTNGNLLCVINGSQGATDSTTAVAISDTLGNTWTPVWSSLQSPSGGSIPKFIMGWYCLTKASGANTVTCVLTQTGTIGSNAVFAAEFSGFSASATLDQKATAASSSSTTMNELDFNNTLANDAMFVASLTNNVQASASTVNSPFTGAFFSPTGGSYNYLIAYGAEASSGLYKFTGTWNAGAGTMQWAAGFTVSAGAIISGNAGVAGATVSYTGTASGSVTADGSGNYSITGLSNGSYTITPSLTGYTFSPTSASETVSGSNITGVNFTASATTYSISGNAGVAGATVSYTGTAGGSVTADGSGNYTISGLANGPYTITPTFAGYTFSPSSSPETVSGSNITGVNFTATIVPPSTSTGSFGFVFKLDF